MNIRSHKLSVWLGLSALVLAMVATLPLSAQQIQPNEQTQSNQISSDIKDETGGAKKNTAPKAEAVPAPTPSGSYNWAGFYFGGHAGYGYGKARAHFEPLPSAATFINMAPATFGIKPKGINGGIQAGYNWQKGKFVFGPEADFSWSDMRKTVIVNPIVQNNGTPFPGAGFQSSTHKTEWFGSLRWRSGVAVGNVLIYGTAGFAYAHIKYINTVDFRPVGTTQYPAFNSRTPQGYTVGGGAEFGVTSHISIKAEYLYYDVRGASFTANPIPALPPFQVRYDWSHTKVNSFNTGINFRF